MGYKQTNYEMEKGTRFKSSMQIIQKLNTLNSSNKKLDVESYFNLTEKQRFEYLMNLYGHLDPYWLNSYNRLEETKPENVQTPLPQDYNISKIIQGASGETILEKTLSMYAANKIAHICENSRNNILESYFYNQNIKLQYNDFKKVSNLIYKAFDPSIATNPKLSQNLYRTLQYYNITPNDIANLHHLGMDTLSQTQRSAFAIKDFEMDNVIAELKQTNISYGKCSTQMKNSKGEYLFNKDNTPKMEHLLVIDLPYYGQFSVHMKTENSISALSDTPYDELRIYEKESIMLTDYLSKQAEKDLKNNKFLSIQELKELLKKDPRYAHYLALKSGAEKTDLDQLYEGYKPKQKKHKSHNSR